MKYYVGLDVSIKWTHICVLGDDGTIALQGRCDSHPELIGDALKRWFGEIELVGLETGSLTPWLYHGLQGLGFPVVCMDARRACDAVKARPEKSDKADARALAEMLAAGWYSKVYVKSQQSHRLKALLGAREQLVSIKRQLYGQVRGLLRPFGIKIASRAGSKRFDEAVRISLAHDGLLYASVSPLLEALIAIETQIAGMDRVLRSIVQKNKACWHLMSVPGVGRLTALSFVATIEDPFRFSSNRDVGAYLGLTPRRYQSGERDVTLGISRQGDAMTRH